jgi:hypothetical protein
MEWETSKKSFENGKRTENDSGTLADTMHTEKPQPQLPMEVLEIIVSHVSVKDLMSVASTSKAWKAGCMTLVLMNLYFSSSKPIYSALMRLLNSFAYHERKGKSFCKTLMDPDLLREMLVICYNDEDYVQALRYFIYSRVTPNPPSSKNSRYVKLMCTLSLPILSHREKLKVFVAAGAFFSHRPLKRWSLRLIVERVFLLSVFTFLFARVEVDHRRQNWWDLHLD